MIIRPTWRATSLILAVLATACTVDGTAPEPMASTAAESASSGAPSPIEGYDWNLTSGGGEARLVYGVANSDNAVIGLSCTEGSGQVELFSDTVADQTPEFHLEAGGDTARITAASEPSAMTGGQFLTASAGAGEPVFRRFRDAGWLAIWRGGERAVLVSHPGTEQSVERFFSACG